MENISCECLFKFIAACDNVDVYHVHLTLMLTKYTETYGQTMLVKIKWNVSHADNATL